jgi:hypothetical protein
MIVNVAGIRAPVEPVAPETVVEPLPAPEPPPEPVVVRALPVVDPPVVVVGLVVEDGDDAVGAVVPGEVVVAEGLVTEWCDAPQPARISTTRTAPSAI